MSKTAKIAKLKRALLVSAPSIALLLSQGASAQTVQDTAAAVPNPVKASTNDINPFAGDIDPFTGDLNPFNGDLNPFTGDIDPFAGDINPFTGDIDPFAGDINPFWGSIDPATRIVNRNAPAWSAIGTYWSTATKSWQGISEQAAVLRAGDLAASAQFAASLNSFLAQAEATWGRAVTAKTGASFQIGFVAPLFAKYGISATNPGALANLSTAQRNRFFLDWYDGLMAYSGADRVDWWMSAVRWSPAITQQQGNGADTVIGLLDADARSNADLANNIVWSGGHSSSVGGHGAAVASLMVAAHDGKGVMGIAPRARVVAYDPFDATNSASWDDVQTGVTNLRKRGASVINASLGVPGWTLPQEWQGVMATIQRIESIPAPNPANGLVAVTTSSNSNPVYVIAAGNGGATQTQDVNWDFNIDPSFLVVGSVDPSGTISSFSNRPGTVCLLKAGSCSTNDLLMNHFIVAPGELLLVSDGTTSGVVRASGTSFAAPLVSGAIALLHDRWPWLARYPQETVKIITDTARDLGAPGVDPVYGVGMLDIEHSQSPIDFNNLYFFEVKNGVTTQVTAAQLLANGVQASWEADGVYFTLFEKIGNTYRDFQVPLSSRLTGWVRTWAGKREHFQNFITGRFTDWINGDDGFSDVGNYTFAMPNGTSFGFAGSAPITTDQGRSYISHSAVTVELPGNGLALTAGQGFGALVNGTQPGFARSTEYQTSGGGANPLLGLASGGAFMQAKTKLGRGAVSIGFTENHMAFRDSGLSNASERVGIRGLEPYRANAVNLHLTQPVGNSLTVAFDYARVREANALLGVQSSIASDLVGGSTTDAFGVGAQLELGGGMAIAVTGTQGRTRSDRNQALVTDGAIASSAYALSIQKHGLATRGDLLAVAISQPLQVHSSTLSLTGAQVSDRSTGALGNVTQSFGIGGEPSQIAGELQYGAPFADGNGRISLYGKGDLQAAPDSSRAFVVGGHASIRF